MNNTLKTIIWITTAIAVVSLGIAAVLFFATDMTGIWDKENGLTVDEQGAFEVGGIGKLEVQTSSTDVYLSTGQGNRIEIRLHGTVYTGQADAVPTLAANQDGSTLEISTERRDGRKWMLGFFSSDLVLEIQVPEQYRGSLNVNTSSGDVQIDDQILSELNVETSSGTIRLSSVQAAAITMDSASGDQTAEGMIAKSSEMTSSSGEIQVTGLEGGTRVESSSGDITLRCAAFTADMDVRSSSGDVELYLTEAAEFRVEARSSSGDIDCVFPVTLNGEDGETRRNRLNGTVGGGTHRVVVQTSSGDITIRP